MLAIVETFRNVTRLDRLIMNDMHSAVTTNPWRARLDLSFAAVAGRTVLARKQHHGPLVVQRPFYPEGGVCHTYVLHPPGGVVGGDQMQLLVEVGPGAHTLMTTPAANKFYRSGGAEAQLFQHLKVQAGATLEWLPQETLLFDGSHVSMTTRVDLAVDGQFIGWEMIGLGRPASGERYTRGALRQRLEIWQAGEPQFIERACWQGGDAVLAAPWGLADHPVVATMLVTPASAIDIPRLRSQLKKEQGGLNSLSCVNNVLVCRYLGAQTEAARAWLVQVWRHIRPRLCQRPSCEPRIWAT